MNPLFMDRSISPTTDFYQYSNGVWLQNAQIPNDASAISATAQARQRNEVLMWSIVAPTVLDYSSPAGSPEQLVGQFIRTGLNRDLADSLRFRPIETELGRIATIQTRGDLISEIARLQRWSIDVGFRTKVDFDYLNSSRKLLCLSQGGLSLFGRERYVADDSKAKNIRARLSRCIEKTFQLLGDTEDTASNSSERVLAIETKLADAFKPEAEVGGIVANFHPIKVSSLSTLAPKVDWSRYFQELGVKNIDTINAAQPPYITAFASAFSQFPVSDWQQYLRWRLASAASPFLSSEFAQQSFKLDSALTGQELMRNRREVVLEEADSCLGNELGQLLARTEFAAHSKSKVQLMVQTIRAAIREKISGLDWMAPSTKAKALEKLDRMQVSVCYPDHWRDAANLVIKNDSFVQNVFRAREFEFQRQVDSVSKPVDRFEWDVRAYAVDAHYNPSLNAIILPAGVLQAPYFDILADDASNYGSFGAVIGHEMMHAFDGRGRKFDAEGNLKNWWSEADGLNFDEHQKGFVTQYDAYSMQDKMFVNGKLTLEENVADLGGVLAAYAAFKQSPCFTCAKSVNGFTPAQRFFISFGQLFRAKLRPESERLELESDPHSPPKFRVKGVLQNMPEFWKAFNAEPPKTMLRIW